MSLNVAVSLDQFFLNNLINNLAFVLKIDISRIRVVKIISEDSLRRKRHLLATNGINTVTLEFGDPPAMSVTPPAVASVEKEWREGNGETDSVDMEVSIICFQ